MNMVPPLTSLRSYLVYRFSVLRMRALRDRFWAKLYGAPTELIVFPGDHGLVSPSRKLIGIQAIRLADVIGTFSRDTDFDLQFRPLKKHAAARWVNAYILHELDGWPPVVVHKVGEEYFVEDGHHRVSAARAIGLEFIDAKVWEYSQPNLPIQKCRPARATEKSSTKAYTTG